MSSGERRLQFRLGVAAWLCAGGAMIGLAQGSSPGTRIEFREVSEQWGLLFEHGSGASGEHYMMEASTGGVIILDYDGDGDDDVLMIDGGVLPGYEGEPPRSVLFRNEGAGSFLDVTDASGLVGSSYGTGGTAGDVDGDGDLDLYLTGYRDSRLLRNLGDGTFEDVTAQSGTADAEWTTSAAFADLDRDGDLDLYVARYVAYALANPTRCYDPAGALAYCHPDVFDAVPDRLLLNVGDATFTDASDTAGGAEPGKGLGVLIADFDDDDWPDIYVANDKTPNYLLRNLGDGSFEDISVLSGTAYGDRFTAEAGMGVDLSDVDQDGDFDIVVTNYALETNALYLNFGSGLFTDGRHLTGLAEPSIPKLGFGVDFADFDQDGDEDLLIANGHVLDNIEDERPSLSYRQANQILENRGGRFVECPDCGLDVIRVSRGLATGDLDGDGDLDAVFVNTDDRAEVYENVSPGTGAWLQLELHGRPPNTAGIGAKLRLRAGNRTQTTQTVTASSFQSQNSLIRHFGLGSAARVDVLDVAWPRPGRQRFIGLLANRRYHLYEADASAAPFGAAAGES